MIIEINRTTPKEVVGDLNPSICCVCGQSIALPFVWVVFEDGSPPTLDHFVHKDCLKALEHGRFTTPN